LLALARATNDPRWLAHATAIVQSACEKFWRADSGWVEALANDSGRIAAIGGVDDGAVPSGAGVITQCLVTLAQLTGNKMWAGRAFDGLDRASGAIAQKSTSAARSLMAARELRALLPGRVPGGAAPSPVRMELVAMNHSFDQFELRIDIDAGHHVAAHDIEATSAIANASAIATPSATASFSPLHISACDSGVTLKCMFPNPTRRADDSVCYQGKCVIQVSVITPRPTPRPLRLSVRMQVCTDISCLAPEDRLIEG